MFWWEGRGPGGLRVAFTDTAAGNLALHVGDDPGVVLGRRRALEEHMGVRPGGLRFMEQVHSAIVASVPDPAAPAGVPTADALLSTDGSTPLAVMVADCLPVLFAGTAPGGKLVTAAAHAGRRGLLDGILLNTVHALRDAGAADISAWIGPGVCGRCYEVPASMLDEAVHLPGAISRTSWGTPALDLPAAAAAQLATLSVDTERVPGCTMEEKDLFSHRRDAPTGRFAGVIW
ncbi:polyphenol oxidase family protein [Arthrobacter caoxuetaonis]|uniref:Polyphenol oxidase family protein n=1 Tax=Arthrobacter caoxuetaonis TaxID=2886935 RepID=A0A9X1MH36_9MICC|nr:polyphenol oxidase family protein [Arthrobacter caoxuetaonis]MCC3299150.1 polyphenol oxidase family protein [Arthrobacter caoxuetaonis]USQ58520.1 polyphenol oxidase family protein [Arthrobacter caoxuetaonis]